MTRDCPLCGAEFDGNRGIGIHMGNEHDGRPWMPEDKLRELYHSKGYSQRDIAEYFDSSQKVVLESMNYYGIESDKARNDSTRPPSHRFDKKSDVVGTEYEQVQVTQDYQTKTVSIHRLIAIAYGKLDPSEYFDPDVVIHHKSGHGLDNRPENIEVMDRGDHQTHHLQERYG